VRIRQHVNPTLSYYDTFRGVRPDLDPARPLEVEIGCADAQFLFERAAQDPTRHYVGLEIRDELVVWVNRKAAACGAPVVAVFAHAQKHLADIFAPASIDRVYVNFPDPWFKRRHAHRRMVDDELVAGLIPLLKPDADVFMQTDVWDLALAGLEAFEGRDDCLRQPGRAVVVLADRQPVRRAVVARAERRGDRPADLAPALPSTVR
jgi:tRNA (guanine-N7-)-methyltransferase